MYVSDLSINIYMGIFFMGHETGSSFIPVSYYETRRVSYPCFIPLFHTPSLKRMFHIPVSYPIGLKHMTVESSGRCGCGGGSRGALFEDRCGDILGQSRP